MKKVGSLIVAVALLVVAASQIETLPEYAETFPPSLHTTFLHIAVWQWLGLAAVLVLALAAGQVGRSIAKRLTHFRDRFAPEAMSEGTRGAIVRAIGLVTAAVIGGALLPDLNIRSAYENALTLTAQALTVLGSVWALYSWWDAVCDTIASRAVGHQRAERLLVPMLRKFMRAVIVIGGVLIAIGLFGGTRAITSLIATLGISGLVIALAAKDSVENLFGSLTILFDMPFAIGDWVKIGTTEGVVDEINLRSTRLRTFEDTIITVPNANLIRASVENYGARRFRRQKVSLRLSYDCKAEAIEAYCADLKKWIEAMPEAQPGKTIVELNDPQEQSIGVNLVCNLEVPTADEEGRLRHRILEEALRLRGTHGVMFAAHPRPVPPSESPAAPNSLH